MGSEKALVLYGGLPMGQRVARSLATRCATVAVVGKNPRLTELGIRWVPDVMTEYHPLVGILTAMLDAPAPWVLVAPCDLPHMRQEHLQKLLSPGGPTVACSEDGLHPLLALLPASWAPRARELVLNNAPVRHLMETATRVWLPPTALVNINCVQDVQPT